MRGRATDPATASSPSSQKRKPVERKGPDDDPDFLWNLKKERFKAQREQERRIEEARERYDRETKKEKRAGQDAPSAKDEGEPATGESNTDKSNDNRCEGRTDGHGDGRNDGQSEGRGEGAA